MADPLPGGWDREDRDLGPALTSLRAGRAALDLPSGPRRNDREVGGRILEQAQEGPECHAVSVDRDSSRSRTPRSGRSPAASPSRASPSSWSVAWAWSEIRPSTVLIAPFSTVNVHFSPVSVNFQPSTRWTGPRVHRSSAWPSRRRAGRCRGRAGCRATVPSVRPRVLLPAARAHPRGRRFARSRSRSGSRAARRLRPGGRGPPGCQGLQRRRARQGSRPSARRPNRAATRANLERPFAPADRIDVARAGIGRRQWIQVDRVAVVDAEVALEDGPGVVPQGAVVAARVPEVGQRLGQFDGLGDLFAVDPALDSRMV